MKRREVLQRFSFVAIMLAVPGIIRAQQAGRLPTMGYLSDSAPAAGPTGRMIDAFVQRLKELGYVDGKNLAIEYRFTERKPDRWTEAAADFVRLDVAVIVTESGMGAVHAKKATQTIPIVMSGSGNPVGQGLVASLERPGGNVTGLTDWSPEIVKGRLQILSELVPNLARVGALWPGAGHPTIDQEWADYSAAAKQLNIQLHPIEARTDADLPRAFAEATREKVQALAIFSNPSLIASASKQIAELAVVNRLPTVSHLPRYPLSGGLMSYGANPATFASQAAGYVDRILKGAKPGELPVEGPTKATWVINLKAAKAIDLTIPPALLARADEVIQ